MISLWFLLFFKWFWTWKVFLFSEHIFIFISTMVASCLFNCLYTRDHLLSTMRSSFCFLNIIIEQTGRPLSFFSIWSGGQKFQNEFLNFLSQPLYVNRTNVRLAPGGKFVRRSKKRYAMFKLLLLKTYLTDIVINWQMVGCELKLHLV